MEPGAGAKGDGEAGKPFAFASREDVRAVTGKAWAQRLRSPLSYSSRRGHLYALGSAGSIIVIDLKRETRGKAKANKEVGHRRNSYLVPRTNLSYPQSHHTRTHTRSLFDLSVADAAPHLSSAYGVFAGAL